MVGLSATEIITELVEDDVEDGVDVDEDVSSSEVEMNDSKRSLNDFERREGGTGETKLVSDFSSNWLRSGEERGVKRERSSKIPQMEEATGDKWHRVSRSDEG